VILFIALPEAKDNIDAEIPLDRLPRRCPVCENDTIIGHGRRLRQCHDDRRESIWVRRGICQPCKKTFTILPDWLAPSAHYTLRCRQEACEWITAGESVASRTALQRSVPFGGSFYLAPMGAINVRTVALPDDHDPNSFFVQGGDARQFQSLLEVAQ
jgi:hypothetical protein